MSYGAIIVVRNSSRKVIDIITFKKRRQGSRILAGINRHFATVHLSNEGMKCGTAVLQGINENCYVLSKQNRPAINPDFDPDRSCLFDVFQSNVYPLYTLSSIFARYTFINTNYIPPKRCVQVELQQYRQDQILLQHYHP